MQIFFTSDMNAPMQYYFLPNRYERDLWIYVFLESYIDLTEQIYYVIFVLLSITPCETF